MKLGIIGLGVIGTANKFGFELLGHEVVCHDIKFDTKVSDLIKTEIIFVCVPTPSLESGECDTSIVSSILDELFVLNYTGIIAIRSTVTPGYVERSSKLYDKLKICFVPEFLRERCATDDFIFNHQLLVVGTNSEDVYNKIVEAHGHLPKSTALLTSTEAELLKYFNNVYAALRITFANIFYEASTKLGANYSNIKEAYLKTGKTSGLYLDASQKIRGYGGMCLPKDTKAFISLLQSLNLDFDLIKSIDADNSKFECTVFDGMRK